MGYDPAKAKTLAREGRSANQSGKPAEARQLFEEAHRLCPPDMPKEKATFLISAANMCLKLNEFQDAQAYYLEVQSMSNVDGEIRQMCEQKLSDPRLMALTRPAAPSSGAAANFFAGRKKDSVAGAPTRKPDEAQSLQPSSAATAARQRAAEAQRKADESAAEIAALIAEEKAQLEREQREASERAKREAEELDRERTRERELAAHQKSREDKLVREREEAEKAREAEKQKVNSDKSRFKQLEEQERRNKEEVAQLKAKLEKQERERAARLADDQKAKSEALARARQEAAEVAERARTDALQARHKEESRLRQQAEERQREADEQARRVEEELAKARASIAQHYPDWSGGAGGASRGRLHSCDDLGAVPLEVTGDLRPIGSTVLPVIEEDRKRRGMDLFCGGKKRALEATRNQLEDVKAQLADALKEKVSLEERNKKLYEAGIKLREEAAKEVADARASAYRSGGGTDIELRARLAELETHNSSLVSKLNALLESSAAPPAPALRTRDSGSTEQTSDTTSVATSAAMAVMGTAMAGNATEEVMARLHTSGVLRVYLQHANNLMSADSNGYSDPYVKISSGGMSKTSSTKKRTLDPRWNETIELKGTLSDFMQQGLTLKFMDWDLASRDDPLGELHVPLDRLRMVDDDSFTDWPLPTQGTVTFNVSWEPHGKTRSRISKIVGSSKESSKPAPLTASNLGTISTIAEDTQARGSGPASSRQTSFRNGLNNSGAASTEDPFARVSSRGRLRFNLNRAEGLLAADANGLSDPYVVVSTWMGKGYVDRRSSVKKKTLHPEWHGEVLEFEGMLQTFLSHGLNIKVWDHDTFSFNDPLGDVWIDVDGLRELNDLGDVTKELPTQGTLTFRVTWDALPLPAGQRPTRHPVLEGEARKASTGMLRIHLERGVDLVAMDVSGRADPYVTAYIDGKTKKTNKCKGTFRSVESALNPIWDETLEFHGTLAAFMVDTLHLKVKDWDMITADDAMGEVSVDLDDLRLKDYHAYEVSLTSAGGDPRGVIRFSCHWIAKEGLVLPKRVDGTTTAAAAAIAVAADVPLPTVAFTPVIVDRQLPDLPGTTGLRPRQVEDLAPMGRQRALTAAFTLVDPELQGTDDTDQAARPDDPNAPSNRIRSVTMARRQRRDTMMTAYRRNKSRGRMTMSGGGGGVMDSATLARSFLMPSEREGWKRFVREALMPGVDPNNPFSNPRDQEIMFGAKPISGVEPKDDTPREAREGGRVSFIGLKFADRNFAVAQTSTPNEILAKVRLDQKGAEHYRPAEDSPRGPGTVPKLHNLLENLKERAIQSSYGLRNSRDNLTKVRRYVSAIWKDTNRLSARECQQLLSEMFYQVAQAPNEVKKLGEFWLELLNTSLTEPKHTFLEPSRLTLLSFKEVFIGSDALMLLVCHFIRSAPDKRPDGQTDSDWGCKASEERRGGLTIRVIEGMMRICLECNTEMLRGLRNQIETMAALVHSMEAPSLIVSAAHMDVHALATIYSTFLSSFKHGGAEPAVASVTTQQIERLEKMALVRQQLRRQLHAIGATYDPPPHEFATLSTPQDDKRVRGALGGGGGADSLEAREVRTMHEMQEMLPRGMDRSGRLNEMEELLRIKHVLAPQKIWSCPSLDELFRQLNGVKTRLLGRSCEVIKMPDPPKELTSKPAASNKAMSGIVPPKEIAKQQGLLDKVVENFWGVASEEEAAKERFQLHVSVKSAKSLKDGNSKVYARVRAQGYKFYTPHVRRTQTAQGVEVYSFRQLQPFTFGDRSKGVLVGDDDEIEVYLWEDVLGPDTPLGHVEVPVSMLRVYKEPHGAWYELIKDKKPAGQVYLLLHLEALNVGADKHGDPTAPKPSEAGRDVENDHFHFSGQWRGFFWQPHVTLAQTNAHSDGDAIQLSEMELVFSDGGELPFPHQRMSGTGTDALGAWELRAGRRYTSAHNIEWVKTYTALRSAYAQLDPNKFAEAAEEADKEAKEGGTPVPVQSEALECVPEVFCEGQMEPRTSIISGRWHMCWRMSARCYTAPKYDGDDSPRKVWCAQRAFPSSVAALVLQIRKPELWDQRFELARLVEDKRLQRPKEKRNDPLTMPEWKDIVKSPKLDGFIENSKGGDPNEALMKGVRKAKLLIEESQKAQPMVKFEPEGWSPSDGNDWQMVEIQLPSVHVAGQFVLWQKGLPQHIIYRELAAHMPHVHISSLIPPTVGAITPTGADGALTRMLGNEASMASQLCLILELGKIDKLNHFATEAGLAPNLYVEAKVGGQTLLTQPLVANKANSIPSEALVDERFVVFLDGDAEHEVRNGDLQVEVNLVHKQIEDENYDQDNDRQGGDEFRQSIGGPPFFCASLGEQLIDLMERALVKEIEKIKYEEDLDLRRAKGIYGFFADMMNVADKFATSLVGLVSLDPEYTSWADRPPKAPKDVLLATGRLEVTKDVRLQEAPRKAKIKLTCPMDRLLLNRKVDKELTKNVKARFEMALSAQKVTEIASLVQALGFADMDALLKSLVISKEDIGMLLASTELQESELLVGRLHVRLACVEWRFGQSDAPAAPLVTAPASGSSRNIFQGFDDIGTNPYDVNTHGNFVQYVWETQEHRDMKKMVDKLETKFAIELEQQKALNVLKKRVESRQMELTFARKRQRELQMLEGLTDFVRQYYKESSVLLDAVKNRYASAGHASLIWAADPKDYTENLFEAQKVAMIPGEDAASVKTIQALLAKQSDFLEIWHGGFERAALAGAPSKEEKELTRELAQSNKTLGQGGQAHWDHFKSQKRKLANLEALSFARMDAQHNGMLRRYNGALSVLQTLEDALKSILPNDYRNSRVILLLTVGHYFRHWLHMPRNWADAKNIGESIFNSIVYIGNKARPASRFHGEVVRLDMFHRDQQRAIVQEAKSVRMAPLAALALAEEKRVAAGEPTDNDRYQQGLFLTDADYRLCKNVEKLIDSLSEKREYIEKVMELDGEMAPRLEPPPVHAYHIHVCTYSSPRVVDSAGAILKLTHRLEIQPGVLGEEKTIDLEIDADNLMRTFKDEVEVKDEGFFGWRLQQVDAEKDKESGRNAYGAGRRVKDSRLFESRTTDIFHVEFRDDLGEITGIALHAKENQRSLFAQLEGSSAADGVGSEDDRWMVDKVTVYKAPTTGAQNDWAAWSYDATGRSWLFQSLTTMSRKRFSKAPSGLEKWGPIPVGGPGTWTYFKPQAVLHIVVQLSEVAQEPDDDDLFVTLHNTAASPPLKSGQCSLGKVRALPSEEGTTARHFVLHYDDAGESLLFLGGVDELEVERKPGGAPYVLESVSIWWRTTETLRHFPCTEWLDRYEGSAFTTEPFQMRKRLRCSPKGPKADGCFHLGAPPSAPKAPMLEVRDVAGFSQYITAVQTDQGTKLPEAPPQMLAVQVEAPATGWGKDLVKGVTWRLQCVPEEVRPGESGGDAAGDGNRAKLHGFEMSLRANQLRVELPLTGEKAIKIGDKPLEQGRSYLWRVAAKHAVFGEGPFSACARVTLYQDVTTGTIEGQPPGWRLYDYDVISNRVLARSSELLRTEVVNSLALGGPNPPELLPPGDASVKRIQAIARGGLAHLSPLSFEDAERPPADERPLLSLVGDAEVVNGAVDLTPLRKGCGLSGAAWFHRPLKVVEGFETTFTFVIRPPNADEDEWGKERSRGSDGFAFVLQLDRSCIVDSGVKKGLSRALGASGIQLGYGGLTSCFAVQFATQPSCRRKLMKKSAKVDGEGDGTHFLCSLLYEPHYLLNGDLDVAKSKRSHFYVDAKFESKECLDPISNKVFVAPELPPDRKPAFEKIELSHHCDSVSVQCPGVHPKARNTSGPEACMARASKPNLDDSEPHTARILLERNRFRARSVAKTDEEKEALEQMGALADGSPSHRLLVYVDDMQTALINLELDLPDVFGDTLADDADSPYDGCMFAGFTAGTGFNNASHIITSWKFYEVKDIKKDRDDDDFFGIKGFLGLDRTAE